MEQRSQEDFLGRTCDAWISVFRKRESCASLVVQGNGFDPLLHESAVVPYLRPAGEMGHGQTGKRSIWCRQANQTVHGYKADFNEHGFMQVRLC